MAMSRKDYIETAEIIKQQVDTPEFADYGLYASAVTTIANELANMFKRDNGRFDRDKFMAACGL